MPPDKNFLHSLLPRAPCCPLARTFPLLGRRCFSVQQGLGVCRYFQSKNCVYQGGGREERRSRVKHLLLRTPKMVTRYCAPLCAARRPPPSHSFFHSFCPLLPAFLPPLSLSLSSPIPSINQRQVMAIFASISLLGSGANSAAAAAAPYLEWPIGGERRREEGEREGA